MKGLYLPGSPAAGILDLRLKLLWDSLLPDFRRAAWCPGAGLGHLLLLHTEAKPLQMWIGGHYLANKKSLNLVLSLALPGSSRPRAQPHISNSPHSSL